MADRIPWDEFGIKYAKLFPSDTGNVAKPLRMALGALIIQTKFQYADRELVEQIIEDPYLQYFIGLPGYQEEAPFDVNTLVLFRKRISAEILMEVFEYFIEVERSFILSKRCYGMGFFVTKLEETQLTSIALSVFVTNLFKIQKRIFCAFLYLLQFLHGWVKCKRWDLQISA